MTATLNLALELNTEMINITLVKHCLDTFVYSRKSEG